VFVAAITLQQRAHLSRLQIFLRLPPATIIQGRAMRAALVACAIACSSALAVYAAAAATATAATAHAATTKACRNANLHPTAKNVRAIDAATLCLINRIRVAHGLRPLHANSALSVVAGSQGASMVRHDYFADVRPSGQTPLALVALTHYAPHTVAFSVGEDIAWGTGIDTTPRRIVAQWLASPPHREVMLGSDYRDAGVAVTPGLPAVLRAGRRGATYVIDFGVRF
jgi:uncharacterized protein YkwD